jgi:hypothetical protein
MVKNAINLYDYHIVMVKDVRLLISSSKSFGEVGKYKEVLTFSLWPLNTYYDLIRDDKKYSLKEKFNYLLREFFSSYSEALKPYLTSEKIEGTNIIFDKEHWLGKLFDKYKGNFEYEGCFNPSPDLKFAVSLWDALASLSKESRTELSGKLLYYPFATTPGGLTVGAFVKAGDSKLILHPKLSFKDENLFKKFAREFLNEIKANILGVKYPQIPKPRWFDELYAEDYDKLMNEAESFLKSYERKLKNLELLKALHWETGDELVKAVGLAFKEIGFDVEDVSTKYESKDLIIRFGSSQFLVEVKGKEAGADKSDVSNFITNNPNENLIFVVNHYRFENPKEREDKSSYPPYTKSALNSIRVSISGKTIKRFYPITSMDLAKWLYRKLTPQEVLKELNKTAQNYLAEKLT